jgi:hypothetical protein
MEDSPMHRSHSSRFGRLPKSQPIFEWQQLPLGTASSMTRWVRSSLESLLRVLSETSWVVQPKTRLDGTSK